MGEQIRQISLKFVPTAILSRQVAVIRGNSLIINLPGQPKAIAETLEGLKNADGSQAVAGIFAAVPYCVDLIGGPYMETNDAVCKAFRPKTAIRAPKTELDRVCSSILNKRLCGSLLPDQLIQLLRLKALFERSIARHTIAHFASANQLLQSLPQQRDLVVCVVALLTKPRSAWLTGSSSFVMP